jgi:hypothetical protein
VKTGRQQTTQKHRLQINETERQREHPHLDSFDYVFARKAFIIGSLTTPEELGGNDNVRAFPSQLPDGGTHDLLSPTVGVNLRIIEEVDAGFPASRQQHLGILYVQLVPEAHPCAIAQSTDFESRPTQVPVLHNFQTSNDSSSLLSHQRLAQQTTKKSSREQTNKPTDKRNTQRSCGLFL